MPVDARSWPTERIICEAPPLQSGAMWFVVARAERSWTQMLPFYLSAKTSRPSSAL